MKIKQQTFKGFQCEIEDSASFIEYYTKNAPLLQGHLLILKGSVTSEVKTFLDEKNAIYVDTNEKKLQMRKKKSTAVLDLSEEKANALIGLTKKNATVFEGPVRSGEVIKSDNDLVFFSRINSGALIESSASIQIFGIIDGLVKCHGDFIVLKNIAKGTVLFHEEELDKSLFKGELKLVEYINGTIVIKDIK